MNLTLLENALNEASSDEFRKEFDNLSDDQKFACYTMP